MDGGKGGGLLVMSVKGSIGGFCVNNSSRWVQAPGALV